VRRAEDRQSNFEIHAVGYGGFRIFALIDLQDGSVLKLAHDLNFGVPYSAQEAQSNLDVSAIEASATEAIKAPGSSEKTDLTSPSHGKSATQLSIPRIQAELYFAESINITVKHSLLNSPVDLPDDTVIEGENRLMGELFGTNNGKTEWASVKNWFGNFPSTSEYNLKVLNEISHAICHLYNNRKVIPIQGVIFVQQGPKRYRPVIIRALELPTGRIGCEFLLVEDVDNQLENVDRYLAVLLILIRMSVRIRWEIIRPFVSNVRLLAHRDPRKLRLDLQTAFNNIFLEAESRGNYSPVDVWDAFESDEDKSKIESMIEEWNHTYPKIWQGIGFMDVRQTFDEVSDLPFSDEDLALLDTGLRELEQMNRDLLNMVVVRAEVLIQRELGITNSGPKAQDRGIATVSARSKSARRPMPPTRKHRVGSTQTC
jgi:hypothetical protein